MLNGDNAKCEWLLRILKKLPQLNESKHCSYGKNECYEKWMIWWWRYEEWVSYIDMCIDLDALMMQKMNDEKEEKVQKKLPQFVASKHRSHGKILLRSK